MTSGVGAWSACTWRSTTRLLDLTLTIMLTLLQAERRMATIESTRPLATSMETRVRSMWRDRLTRAIVEKNLTASNLVGLIVELRRGNAMHTADEFDALLGGREEPVHQFSNSPEYMSYE